MIDTQSKPKEGLGLGTFFVILIFILLIVGALQLTGGSPVNHSPSGTQVITIIPISPEPTKNRLQLYTFGGVTQPPSIGSAKVTPIAGTLPGQIVNINTSGSTGQTINININITGQPKTTGSKPSGSTPECGIANPILQLGKDSSGNCCVEDGAANSAGECCPGVQDFPNSFANPFSKTGERYAHWCDAKPVIYLYPKVKTTVSVKLKVPGTIPVSDPLYPVDGWKNIEAYPDGTFNYLGKTYHELFYEAGIDPIDPPDNGTIASADTLNNTLLQITTKLGLIPSEQQEFLNYWLPKLTELNSPYVLVSVFTPQQKEVIDHVDITPKPDTFIQFIMYYKALQSPLNIHPLQLPDTPPQRNGFTAVEWGGIIDR